MRRSWSRPLWRSCRARSRTYCRLLRSIESASPALRERAVFSDDVGLTGWMGASALLGHHARELPLNGGSIDRQYARGVSDRCNAETLAGTAFDLRDYSVYRTCDVPRHRKIEEMFQVATVFDPAFEKCGPADLGGMSGS